MLNTPAKTRFIFWYKDIVIQRNTGINMFLKRHFQNVYEEYIFSGRIKIRILYHKYRRADNNLLNFSFCFFLFFQINFLLSQVLALFLASLFRSYLHPSKVSSDIRHTYGLTIGLCLGYFCFGQQAIHIAGLPALCYIIIRTQNPQIVQRYE